MIGLIVTSSAVGLVTALVVALHSSLLVDFRGGLWDAGRAILAGRDPYRAGYLAQQVAILRAGGHAAGTAVDYGISVPLYPAPINVLAAGFALLPLWLAGSLQFMLSLLALAAGLHLLGVRDRRCLVAALVSLPTLYGLIVGSIGLWLLLGAAVAWRWRDRLVVVAAATAGVVIAKLFPWPLALWLLFTRRFRAFALAVVIGLVVVAAAWLVVGLDTLWTYPRMLADATTLQQDRSIGVIALLMTIGASPTAAHLVGALCALGLLAVAWSAAQRGDERRCFSAVVLTGLVATPIAWPHYLVLLYVPIALRSPRLSMLWCIPLLCPVLMMISDALPLGPKLSTLLPWVAVEALVATLTCWSPRPRAAASSARSVRPAAARTVA